MSQNIWFGENILIKGTDSVRDTPFIQKIVEMSDGEEVNNQSSLLKFSTPLTKQPQHTSYNSPCMTTPLDSSMRLIRTQLQSNLSLSILSLRVCLTTGLPYLRMQCGNTSEKGNSYYICMVIKICIILVVKHNF